MKALTESRNGAVRDYAVLALAAVGDDRGWEHVLRWLTALLNRARRPSSEPPTVPVAVTYLMRYPSHDEERTQRVVRLLRHRWGRLDEDERDWLSLHWPDAEPSGPPTEEVPPPEPQALHQWILSQPLFGPVYPS